MPKETTSEVTVKILGEASSFRKEMKEASKLTKDMNKLTERFRKSGLKDHKTLSKITNSYNRSQKDVGKRAYALEKKLNRAIKDNIKEMQAKSKTFKGNAEAIRDEIKALKDLEKQQRKLATFRKRMSYTTRGSRIRDAARAAGTGAGKGMMAIGGTGIAAVATIVSSLVGMVSSQIRAGFASYMNYGRARAGLAGMGHEFGAADQKTWDIAESLGFSKRETVQQMRAVGRQTGNINAVTRAQGVARSFGGETSEVSGFMGTLTRAGQGFGGTMGTGGQKQLSRIMAHAFTAGLDRSRAGEHLSAVAQGVKAAQSVTGGRVDASQISAMLSFFGRSKMPGLQGAQGMQQFMKVDQTLKKAGFGATGAGSALAYQSQGFGVPGQNVPFYEATRSLQRGVFGKGGAQNLLKYFKRMGQAGGGFGSEKANLMISRDSGMSLDVIESITKVIAKGGGTAKALKSIEAIMEKERPVEDQILEATKSGHLKVAQRVAFLENRLIEIGRKNFDAIVQLQDVVNDIVDTLMPTAIDTLKAMANTTEQIWFWLKSFGIDWSEINGSDANKKIAASNRLKEQAYKDLSAGRITRAEAAQRIFDASGGVAGGTTEANPILDLVVDMVEMRGGMSGMAVQGTAAEYRLANRARRQVQRARLQNEGWALKSGYDPRTPAGALRVAFEKAGEELAGIPRGVGGVPAPEDMERYEEIYNRRRNLEEQARIMREAQQSYQAPPAHHLLPNGVQVIERGTDIGSVRGGNQRVDGTQGAGRNE
jgi:hypothetical protein